MAGFGVTTEGRMRRHAKVQHAPRAELHNDENIEDFEIYGHRLEEVASYDGRGVVPYEGGPSLVALVARWPKARQVLRDRSRRNKNAQLQRQLVGNAPFAPSCVRASHLTNQLA